MYLLVENIHVFFKISASETNKLYCFTTAHCKYTALLAATVWQKGTLATICFYSCTGSGVHSRYRSTP